MQKYLLYFIFTLVITIPIKSQITKPLLFNIVLDNGFNKPWHNLVLGVAPDASEKMDSAYQESEIPDFPFPSGVFTAVCLTYDSTEKKDIWSYRSIFGPTGDGRKFMVRYKFRVFYGNSNYVKMSWLPLPEEIDSAIIQDSFGGYKFKANMKQTNEARNNEILVENFDVFVYYNFTNVSVDDQNSQYLQVYPNPVSDYIYVKSMFSIKMIEVCNIYGFQLFNINTENSETKIDLSSLRSGIYFLKLFKYNNEVIVKKIIKD